MAFDEADDVDALAKELVINGPIHVSQIPERRDPRTGFSRRSLTVLVERGWAHHILVKGTIGFIASSPKNPFIP